MIFDSEFNKRTKIVATLGPATTGKIFTKEQLADPNNAAKKQKIYNTMQKIFLAGVNVCRLNFSHGDHAEEEVRLQIIKDVAKELNINVAIMLDTKGPEIRVGKIVDSKKKDTTLLVKQDSILTIKTKDFSPCLATNNEVYVYDSTNTYNMAKDLAVDKMILIDDGKLQLRVKSVDVEKGIIKAKALNSHTIYEKKRINLPGSKYTMPFLSKKDKEDIKFAVKYDLDYIALSFVNSAQNIIEVKKELAKLNASEKLQLFAKIESTDAIKNFNEILQEADGIMVARGDLGLEVPFYDIPYWEKYILQQCHKYGKPCIVATQMLDSLERCIQPTRAEVTDVFFAVENGADATMLSGETANGLFPIEAVKVMAAIDAVAEKHFDYKKSIKFYKKNTLIEKQYKRQAIKIAKKVLPCCCTNGTKCLKYENLIIFTNDFELIWAISAIKPACKIIAVTNKSINVNRFAVNYGVQTIFLKKEFNENFDPFVTAKEIKFELNLSDKTLLYNKKKFYDIN